MSEWFPNSSIPANTPDTAVESTSGEPPDDLDSVTLGDVLGDGRHGVVLAATGRQRRRPSTRNDATYALKIPTTGQSLDDEAHALRTLSHPNVVRLIDGPSRSGAILLERCSQGTLGDHPLPPDRARTVLDHLGQALAHIHGLGWIHGDISPGNIGIREDGSVALLDFATARLSDGAEVHEGTADFAGEIRTATPALDIRCAASSVLACLDGESILADALTELVARCDAGLDVAASTLIDLGEPGSSPQSTHMRTDHRTDAPAPDPQSGRSFGARTREFGPRPGPATPDEPVAAPGARGFLLAAAALIAVVAIAGAFIESSGGVEHVAPIDLATTQTAAESLASSGVSWNNGIATVTRDNGAARFTVGLAEDIAAVGDWNCDGSKTLGVYRPSTGTWFTFDSWEADAVSTTTHLGAGSAVFVVTEDSCAVPRLRDV